MSNRDKLRKLMLQDAVNLGNRSRNFGLLINRLISKHALAFLIMSATAVKPGDKAKKKFVVAMYSDDWHTNMLKDETKYSIKTLDLRGIIDELGDTTQCRQVVTQMRDYDPTRDILFLAVDTGPSPREYIFQRLRIQ